MYQFLGGKKMTHPVAIIHWSSFRTGLEPNECLIALLMYRFFFGQISMPVLQGVFMNSSFRGTYLFDQKSDTYEVAIAIGRGVGPKWILPSTTPHFGHWIVGTSARL